jgi:hypothetical protein
VIDSVDQLTLQNGLGLVYESVASAFVWGAVIAIAAIWLSIAVRGDSS